MRQKLRRQPDPTFPYLFSPNFSVIITLPPAVKISERGVLLFVQLTNEFLIFNSVHYNLTTCLTQWGNLVPRAFPDVVVGKSTGNKVSRGKTSNSFNPNSRTFLKT